MQFHYAKMFNIMDLTRNYLKWNPGGIDAHLSLKMDWHLKQPSYGAACGDLEQLSTPFDFSSNSSRKEFEIIF